jgi:hypothetical protein
VLVGRTHANIATQEQHIISNKQLVARRIILLKPDAGAASFGSEETRMMNMNTNELRGFDVDEQPSSSD